MPQASGGRGAARLLLACLTLPVCIALQACGSGEVEPPDTASASEQRALQDAAEMRDDPRLAETAPTASPASDAASDAAPDGAR